MRQRPDGLTLSATDLANFLGCRHRTGLDLAAATGAIERKHQRPDPLVDLLRERGLTHEKQYVDTLRKQGRTVTELHDEEGNRVQRTLEAMAKGVDVIVQGALAGDGWYGRPDILQRVETPSAYGAWSYEVADTKLARETKAGTLLQLGLYTELLAAVQERVPENFYVVTPNPDSPIETYRVNDYAAYFRLIRRQLSANVTRGHDAIRRLYYPEPVDHCEVCDWAPDCRKKRHQDDHLSLVANISRTQRRELEAREITMLTSLATLPLPIAFKPKRGARASYERVREQARVQHESRNRTPPLHETLPLEKDKDGKVLPNGLGRLPGPTRGDLFLDLEGDSFAREGGREYLFGLVAADGSYRAKWAFTDAEERAALEWLMDAIASAVAAHPTMHVYHYAPYEPSALKRLTQRYATREDQLDEMLRAGRFVDLFGVVRQGLRVGVERYSIKNLEPLYGFERTVALPDAGKLLRAMEAGLESGKPEDVPDSVRAGVEGYNRDDCVSTLELRDWLETVRADLIASGTDVPRPMLDDGEPPPKVSERDDAVRVTREKLLAGVPELREHRSADEQARWLLAYMLDYHRREDKATWWKYFELIGTPEDELYDETQVIAGLAWEAEIAQVKRSFVHRYRFPAQEVEIRRKATLRTRDKTSAGTVYAIDRDAQTIDILQGPSIRDERPTSVIAFDYVKVNVVADSLKRIADRFLAREQCDALAWALLRAEPPRLTGARFTRTDGETALDFARRAVLTLDDSVLPIQGPPGAGKTYCGARMILDLVRAGRRVGVAANSHKVILNLLKAVGKAADDAKVSVQLAHYAKDPIAEPPVTALPSYEAAAAAVRDGTVVGGTAWMWCDPDFAESVDVLFVDEAGQAALANVVAMSQCARSIVLLGDPQQLEQPRKGTHPDGVGVSALEHLLAGHRTMPEERGIFLPETWRLAPSICDFTSEIFYEGRLGSRPELAQQKLVNAPHLPAHGLAHIPVEHHGNRNASDEEVDVVADLVGRLLGSGTCWINAKGEQSPLLASDVLVVAPYNAQVNRIAERLAGTGVAVGTVDKFQGQEAPVVIYSMATSRPEDAPRGMEFLYSLNRLNVATSRARCLAILVSSPALFEPECRSPGQMKLANGLCRFRELAAEA